MSPRHSFVAALLLALSACDAVASEPDHSSVVEIRLPALTGRVVDEADLLSNEREAELTARLAALETRRTDQFVVVTVPTLAGRGINGFGVQLGRTWGVGHRGKNNGVLLIVAPRERQVRIEVGYGLETHLKDEEMAEIIRERLLPRFRAGDFEGGILAGVQAIIAELDRSPLVEPRS